MTLLLSIFLTFYSFSGGDQPWCLYNSYMACIVDLWRTVYKKRQLDVSPEE